MAQFNDCHPGGTAVVLRSAVARVVGKTGTIVEVSRSRRPGADQIAERITVDSPGHGEIVVPPADLDLLP
jgi:hypothetical protein